MSYFIGHTATLERVITAKCANLLAKLAAGEPIPVRERRWLFHGPAGTGKTELGWLACRLLTGLPLQRTADTFQIGPGEAEFSVDFLNGKSLNVDVVRAWTDRNCYRPLIGAVSIHFVDEIEGISPDALKDGRTYLDRMANHRVFIATTNTTPEQLPEPLQTRFQVYKFVPVDAPVIAGHLIAKFGLDAATAGRIAGDCQGCVRAAETDTQTELEVRQALAA